ncbi:hypothetical protein SPRG_17971 [Saprolegnia parasitica CBS 223.65]|uniref:Uncharacterized protein n=1 Tax=Saprolegnia parasitica (strain CBS 223.65) TaxID=695850 RepID=A0A067BEF5_SAPPC|nr:hypothetical protein SPRG_17971 [Saprolegnia parasitica CBS 223.65]KDO16513.1 hypothetical protein SPRG_17971 [Saprolegnia parasitica CBS 223.65]|eukprot:XP_012212780.1 hypothetical protein SPRG_17971 [Saprolegnia parasitica CBS 223.65]
MARPQTTLKPPSTAQDSSMMGPEDDGLIPEPTSVQATENDSYQDDGGLTASEKPSDLYQATGDSDTTVQLEEPRYQDDEPTTDETTRRANGEMTSTAVRLAEASSVGEQEGQTTPVQGEPALMQASPRRIHAIVKKPIVHYPAPPPASSSTVAIADVDTDATMPPRSKDMAIKASGMPVVVSRNEPELTGSSMLVGPAATVPVSTTSTLLDELEHYDIEIEKVVKEIEELTRLQRQRQATKPPLVANESYVQLHQTAQTTPTPRTSPKKAGHTSPRRDSPRKLDPIPMTKESSNEEEEKKPEDPPPSYARPTRSRASHLDAPPESPRKLRAAVKPPSRIQAPRQRKPAIHDDKASEVRKEAATKSDKTLPPIEHKDTARKNLLGVPAHILEDGGVYPWSKLMQQVIVPQGTDSPVVYVPIFNPAYIAELKKACPAKPSPIKPSPTKPTRHVRRTNAKPT